MYTHNTDTSKRPRTNPKLRALDPAFRNGFVKDRPRAEVMLIAAISGLSLPHAARKSVCCLHACRKDAGGSSPLR